MALMQWTPMRDLQRLREEMDPVVVAIVAVAIWARRRPRQPKEPPAE